MIAESLLDFSKPINVEIFDQTVKYFFEGKTEYQNVLVKFQRHPQSWTRAHEILEKSCSMQSKMIVLGILEDCIKTRWNILPKQQKDGIKNYIVNLIIKISSNTKTLTELSVFIRKLNMVLVQIVKQEWPKDWPNFIPELVSSSKTSQSICANNMSILLLLSEEVFDFSKGHMTQEKMSRMKNNLNREFTLIFQTCEYILDNSRDPNLLSTTLQTLLRFLNWIPVGYIFETKLIETLAVKFFPVAIFQNDTLRCLTEIGSLVLDPPKPQYNQKLIQMMVMIMQCVKKLLEPNINVADVYKRGQPKAQNFVRHLALFITGFLKTHLNLLEGADIQLRKLLYGALNFLLRISEVDDITIFKICLDYWKVLVAYLYGIQKRHPQPSLILQNMSNAPMAPGVQGYREVLNLLRKILISKMAKPEEVLIVEDENGEIVREQMKDTDSITLYKNMRACLIYLTHLEPIKTQETLISKLKKQVDGSEWSWHNVNTLCWAIGSISGSLSVNQEKTFLVRVIKDLLTLCEMKRGKCNKAVIASNIMYVVGQYPRFLRQHWKFLKTVVNKLFEFMHEPHPGVQDMSCDTFLKISKKCRQKFVSLQVNESQPFLEEILRDLPEITMDLETSQIHTFYEAVAHIVKSQNNPEKRQELLFMLMQLPNQSWRQKIAQAKQNQGILKEESIVKQIILILKTNFRVAESLGYGYLPQLDRIYMELLQVYQYYSDYVSNQIQREGERVAKSLLIRNMRAVKKQTLKLIQCFVLMCQDSQKEFVYTKFLPGLIRLVLADYKRNVNGARDAEVLSLFSAIISKLGIVMVQHVPIIFDSAIQCTLDMINKNFQDYPEHRKNFYPLIRVINNSCFPALLRLEPKQFQLVMDSVVWGFKHLQRDIAENGLNILLELVKNMEKATEVANVFYQNFFLPMIRDLLGVLTDTFHKPGFVLHANILSNLFRIVSSGSITVALWNDGNFPDNQTYVKQNIICLLRDSFSNLTHPQVEVFVNGLFKLHTNLKSFKEHLRDFLIRLKEFNKADNTDLFLDEQKKKAS